MEGLTDIAGYIDQGFAYALVIYLLWERHSLAKGLKETMERLSLLIEERLPRKD